MENIMPGPVDEAFKIRTLQRKINQLSPAGRAYLLARLQEGTTPPVAEAPTPETPATD